MKITDEDFNVLRSAILPLLADPRNANLWENYKAQGLSAKRFRWDLLWASKVNTSPLYKYLNDDHIDTALRAICKPYMGEN